MISFRSAQTTDISPGSAPPRNHAHRHVSGSPSRRLERGNKPLDSSQGRLIIGVDEVGRGSWAGPLVVGAVGLQAKVAGLRDSKLLTAPQRQKLAIHIRQKAVFIGIGWVEAHEIDKIGLSAALTLGAERALAEADKKTSKIILDGNFNFLSHLPTAEAIVKADNLIPAVSAASIIAKVARDEYMAQAAKDHPLYFFERHVGYGTKQHLDAIKEHGICDLHRLSFKPIKLLAGTAA